MTAPLKYTNQHIVCLFHQDPDMKKTNHFSVRDSRLSQALGNTLNFASSLTAESFDANF